MDEKIMNNKVSDLGSRLKAIEDKLFAFRDITEKQLSLINKDTTKQFKYLNEALDALNSTVNDNTITIRRNIQSNTDTTRIIQENLDQIQDLIRMGRAPGGALGQISMRVQDDIEKGPIQAIRETYALRAAVEKDIMKVQNVNKRLMEDQKQLY